MNSEKPTLVDLTVLRIFVANGHRWQLKADALGWLLYRDDVLHMSYADRAGVADDILKDIFGPSLGVGDKIVEYERYGLAMVFGKDDRSVLLIEKGRPDWQRGRLNIPGGKALEGEDLRDTALRELHEETGLSLPAFSLKPLVIMDHVDHRLAVFVGHADISRASNMTDETVLIADPLRLSDRVLASVRWWIGLALDKSAARPIVYRDLTGHEENHDR